MKKLSKNVKIFLGIQCLFGLSIALSSIYVSVYMWKLTSNMLSIISYNIVLSIAIVCNFILASYIGKRNGLNTALRLGIIGNLSFYILILILKERASQLLIYLGFVNGIGSGFYYYAVNNLIYHLTDNNNRGYFFGISGALGAIMNTIAPLISGYIISKNNKFIGYYKIFFFSFLLFTISWILTLFLSKTIENKEFSIKRVISNSNDRYWKILMSIHIFAGLRDGSFGLALSLLTYYILKNEFNMGKLNTVSSIIGITSTYFIGYILNKRNTKYIFLIGVIMNIVSTSILVCFPSIIGIITNSIMNSFFNCFWAIPFSNISYNIAEKCGEKENNVGDYVIAREIPLAIGRVFSLTIFAIVNYSFAYIISIKLILFALCFFLIPVYLISIKQ